MPYSNGSPNAAFFSREQALVRIVDREREAAHRRGRRARRVRRWVMEAQPAPGHAVLGTIRELEARRRWLEDVGRVL